MGNVVITSIGMMGKISGWFLHSTLHPVSFGIGSVVQKPWVVDGEIRIRDILNMTVSFDHDIVDGGDMARFTASLVKKLEKIKFCKNRES
jgi:pyruvate/2-oxoglutarate dehydrogenase complex dihydrolipoamide acyltransferase (E2) component